MLYFGGFHPMLAGGWLDARLWGSHRLLGGLIAFIVLGMDLSIVQILMKREVESA
jgi:hypothetical protein